MIGQLLRRLSFFLWGPTGKGGVFLSLHTPGFEILYINGVGPSLTGKLRERGRLTATAAVCCSLFHNLQGNCSFSL